MTNQYQLKDLDPPQQQADVPPAIPQGGFQQQQPFQPQYQQPIRPLGIPEYDGKATASLVLGLIGLVAWIIPLVGFPITIIGIVMGSKGMKSTKRGMAIAGLILSIVFLLLTAINSFAGAMMAASRYR